MGLKVAFGGKGGVGKTTITSLLARCLATDPKNSVTAIDADPVVNMAAALGISEESPITPISELTDLIAERTGTNTKKDDLLLLKIIL
jgi:CO dehydrogenase maturation factor